MDHLGTTLPSKFCTADPETIRERFSVEEIVRLSTLGAMPTQIAIMAYWSEKYSRPGAWFIEQIESSETDSIVAQQDEVIAKTRDTV